MSSASQLRSKPAPAPSRPVLGSVNGTGKASTSTATKPAASAALPSFTTPSTTATKPRVAPVAPVSLVKPALAAPQSLPDSSANLAQAAPKPTLAAIPSSTAANLDKSKPRIAPTLTAPVIPNATPKAPESQVKSRTNKIIPSGATTPLSSAPPVAIRSYSEIVKSEEALNQLLVRKNAELKELKQSLSEKDSRITTLEAEVESIKQQLTDRIAEVETRMRDTLSLSSQQYQELNTTYLNLTAKCAKLENTLQEAGVNPISLRKFELTDEDQAAIDAEREKFEQLAKEASEEFQQKNKLFMEYKAQTAHIEASLADWLAPVPPMDDLLLSEVNRVDSDILQLMKEIGMHTSAPLGDVSDNFDCSPQQQQEEVDQSQEQHHYEQESSSQFDEEDASHVVEIDRSAVPDNADEEAQMSFEVRGDENEHYPQEQEEAFVGEYAAEDAYHFSQDGEYADENEPLSDKENN